jgi:hypothetical protein
MPRKHPDFIKAYMEYSKHSEAPDRFHFWTAISTIAGALRRQVWIDQHHFQWTPNFYIVFVAPAGIISKSTTAKIGMDLLKQVPNVTFGPNIITWQSLVTSLAEATQSISIDNKFVPMSPLTILSSEFGTFLNPQDREMVDVLVDLWDGQVGTFEKRTKTSGEDSIVNPWINILAATTPHWIADNFPEYMIGGGFVSRTIFVYGDKKRHYCAYLDDAIPAGFKERQADLVNDLKDIAKNCKGEVTLSPEAKAWGTEWYERLFTERPPELASERIASYLARKQTHMHKLAIVLSASQSNSRIIELEHLQAADAILGENEKFLPKVFEKIGDESVQKANNIVNLLRTNGPLSLEEAYSKLFYSMSFSQFKEGLESAIRARLVQQKSEGGKTLLYPIAEVA